ncbi:MAG: hypothetical protein EOP08_12115, partial [Proteobacteria bacterium]
MLARLIRNGSRVSHPPTLTIRRCTRRRGTAPVGSSVNKLAVLLGCAAAIAFGSGAHGAADVSARRLLDAEREPSQWLTYNGSYSEQHYSRLDRIGRENVKRLGLSWFADYDTNLQQQGQPLYVDGVIYVSTAWTKVYAFDAKTGRQIWQYDPHTKGETIRKV